MHPETPKPPSPAPDPAAAAAATATPGQPFPIMEADRRHPTFRGGVPIKLMDGQEWYFPKPRINYGLDDNFEAEVYVDLGDPRYAEAFKAYEAAADDRELTRQSLRMGVILLQSNYNLTNHEAAALIRFQWSSEGDSEANRIREEVMSVALGRGPKPQGGGLDSLP